MTQVRQTVQTRKGSPYIYLWAAGDWYCYNPERMPLGGGAMGTVFKGYCCRTHEPVAIKKVKEKYAANKFIRERAKMECGLAYRHPHMVEMIGYCEYAPDSGPVFIISKFVSGQNIDDFFKTFPSGPEKIEKICHAIYQVLDALDYLHSKGVIHKDIKPSNIMIEDGNNVRLMDLGIASSYYDPKQNMAFSGTPQYSAPEQILANGDSMSAVSPATDIYALGITAYELITGTNPYNFDSVKESVRHQIEDPLPVDDRVPSALMAVLSKATAKHPSDRFQTALQFKEAIQDSLMPKKTFFNRFFK